MTLTEAKIKAQQIALTMPDGDCLDIVRVGPRNFSVDAERTTRHPAYIVHVDWVKTGFYQSYYGWPAVPSRPQETT